MMFRVINDTHCFGPLEDMSFDDLLTSIRTSPYPVILNGDIIDLKNCKKSEVGRAKTCIDLLQTIKGCTYISGNHELWYGKPLLNTIKGTVYFDHSDLLSNASRYVEFRSGEAGASWFKRKFITPLIDDLRHLREPRPSKEMLDKIGQIVLNNPTISDCIFGHAHPDQVIEFQVHGVRCRILPRGVNDVEF